MILLPTFDSFSFQRYYKDKLAQLINIFQNNSILINKYSKKGLYGMEKKLFLQKI